MAVSPSHEPDLRVLLVEDSPYITATLTELISQLPGVDFMGAVASEADALGRISAADPDVLILDLHLRSGSGFGVLRSLRAGGRDARPRVVILTNFPLPEYRRAAESFGVEAFLDKARDYFRLPMLLQEFALERTRNSVQ